MEQYTRVIGIANDFCIHGNGPTEHDALLYHFMRVACQNGLVLNIDKCSVAKQQIASLVTSTTGMDVTQTQKWLKPSMQCPN